MELRPVSESSVFGVSANPGTRRPSGRSGDSPQGDPAQNEEIARLKRRDREVRAHEEAHRAAAGGGVVVGAPQYTTTTGPDGKRYAIGGEVQVRIASTSGDPADRIRAAEALRRVALAPADPSGQDRSVAANAERIKQEARRDLDAQQTTSHPSPHTRSDPPPQSPLPNTSTRSWTA